MKTSNLVLAIVGVAGLLAASASNAFAEPACAVAGVVRDSSGLPVAGAVVTAAPGGASAMSDASGRYCVTGLSDGTPVTLTAAVQGFRPEVVAVASGQRPARSVDFTLSTAAFSDQVVVTATRTSRRLDDVPVRTEVVDKALMRALAARTLADAVEYTTGLRVESNCQNCNFSQIRLLGLEGPYTQILIDGQPVISSLAQVYGIEQIPSRMIERIEIVKGGGSALYGSGSVGGVINVISREPASRGALFETRLDVMGGLPNYSHSGSADWASTDQQTNVTGFFQVDTVKPLDVTGDGFTEVSRRELRSGGARASRYLLNGRAKLTGEVSVLDEFRRGGDLLHLPADQANIAEQVDSARLGLGATWFHSPGPRLDYRITVAAADMRRDSYYGTGKDPNAYGVTDNRLVLVDSQVNQYAGRHTISWGGQLSWDDLRDLLPGYGRFTDAAYRNVGLFVQDDWSFAKGWQLVYGLRADRHSTLDRTVVSPRVALMISPREALDIRASVAGGFRAPQVFDEDLHLSSVGGDIRLIRHDRGLREERSTNYMLGAEWKPEAGRGQALLEVNGFYTSLRDLFHSREDDDPATDAFEFLKVNFGNARVYGVEANTGWGIGDTFIVQGGIVAQTARFGEPEPDFGSLEFFRTPNRYGNLTVTWTTPAFGTLFAGLRYTGPMKAPHYAGFIAEDRLETTPSFVTVDASVAWPVRIAGRRGVTLTVAGRNLTNAYQPDPDQGPLRDGSYVYGPRFPRSVSLGLRAEF